MMQKGLFNPKGFISHKVKLEAVNETMQRMKSGEVLHAIIEF